MSKFTESARGQVCTLRLEGCLLGTETVVLAHINGGGMAMKCLDIHGAYACQNCHDLVDGRKKSNYSKEELLLTHLLGMKRTQELMCSQGIL